MKELNKMFRAEENIALIVCTCPDHSKIKNLSHKKYFFFLPPPKNSICGQANGSVCNKMFQSP